MIAAIYARKSTEQSGVADEQRSVARQAEHGRHYAARKGFTVDDAWIFVDNGISGAEFGKRPGLVRLMAALKPRPPFQVLIMSEESRLGREAIDRIPAQADPAGGRPRVLLPHRHRMHPRQSDGQVPDVRDGLLGRNGARQGAPADSS
jgi:hypothetical protein